MNIHDVVSPSAYTVARILGYGALWVGLGIVIMAGLRIQADARAAYNRHRRHW